MTPSKKPEATKPVTQAAPTPQPQTTAAAKPEPVSKQQQTLDKLKLAWAERKVDMAKLEAKPDGKNLNVVVGAGWPVIVIGNGGGISLPQIRSYPKAWDAAVEGDKYLAKQSERDAKKATQSVKPATPAPAVQPSAKSDVTPAARKKAQHDQIEQRMA